MPFKPSVRTLRHLAVPALAVAVVAAIPLANGSKDGQSGQGWTPMTPVSVQWQEVATDSAVQANLLAFNDFHGAIDPPIGSGGLVAGTPAGGAEYLTTWVKR